MQPAIDAASTAAPIQTMPWRYQALLASCTAASLCRRGDAVRKRVDIGREHARIAFAEPVAPGRHVAVAAVANRLFDRRKAPAPEPDVVGEVGCAQRLVALAVGAMAGGARAEELLALGGADDRGGVARRQRQARHIVGEVRGGPVLDGALLMFVRMVGF